MAGTLGFVGTRGAAGGPGSDVAVEQAAEQALAAVVDPELGESIVELGMVRSVSATEGRLAVEIALTIAGCPLRDQIRGDVERAVRHLPGVQSVEVRTAVMDAEERSALMARARRKAQQSVRTDIPDAARVFAVASGKGGVGKSSVSVNLAAALAERGLVVGVLDADIWGFSIPRMLGLDSELEVRSGKMIPVEMPVGEGRLRVVSMGFLSGEDEAIMWRGLMLNRAVQHFLEDVAWGSDLDVLVVDMPPGTGDVQMGLARMLARAELLVVTTPAEAAEKVAARAADMARRGHLRTVGVVETMAGFTCDHGTTYPIFGEGGGERLAASLDIPLLSSVPLHPSAAAGADAGRPVALDPSSPLRPVFAQLAERVLALGVPATAMAGCSARMLASVKEALGPTG